MLNTLITSLISVTLSIASISTDAASPADDKSTGVRRIPSVISETNESVGIPESSETKSISNTSRKADNNSISAPYTPPKKQILTYIPPVNGKSGKILDSHPGGNGQSIESGNPNPNSSLSEQNFYTNQQNLHDNELKINTIDFPDSHYASLLDDLDLTINSGSEFAPNTYTPTSEESDHCEMLVYRTLEALPYEHTDILEELNLFYSDTGRRGYGGYNKILIRCTNQEDAELSGVMIHEMGHITDLGYLTSTEEDEKSAFMDGSTPIYADDPSVEFYRISWQDSETRKTDSDDLDFVTGYSKTDPFEDFAESYSFYILQGDSFREMSKYNNKIAQKYEFLKNTVFDGVEFDLSDPLEDLVFTRNYDSTVLDYDQEKLFS